MLTPDQVNAYAGQMAAPWDELSERILRDMVRRIVKAGRITATAEWQLYRAQALGASQAYLIRQMNQIVQQISPQQAAVFAQAMKQAYGKDLQDAAAAGRALTPLGESEEAQQILESGYRRTMNTLYNLTQTRAVMSNQNMIQTQQRQLAYYLDMAHADAVSGAFSSDGAARRALNELAERGVGAITYPSGHVDSLDVVVLRATRTGVNQTAGELALHNAAELDCDLMELDAHVGARTGDGGQNLTNHSWWQGQIVSRSGRHGYLSLADIGYGDVRGFMGANCAHNWSMFWEGASKRSYTPERLAAINAATVPYNGRSIPRYKATQMQRAQERKIRAEKRAFLVAKESGQKDAETAAAAKLAASRERLKDFLGQTGLHSYQLRESVPGFSRSEAASAVRAVRNSTLTNTAGQIIIKTDRTDIHGPANGITQKTNAKGGIDRNYYGADGLQIKQISNNGHGHKAEEKFGKHGEHTHDYCYDAQGHLISRLPRELNDQEREENADIL